MGNKKRLEEAEDKLTNLESHIGEIKEICKGAEEALKKCQVDCYLASAVFDKALIEFNKAQIDLDEARKGFERAEEYEPYKC